MTDATLNTIPRDGAERLALILARVRGEFDDPLLVRWGPLGTMEQDLAEMLTGSRVVWSEKPELSLADTRLAIHSHILKASGLDGATGSFVTLATLKDADLHLEAALRAQVERQPYEAPELTPIPPEQIPQEAKDAFERGRAAFEVRAANGASATMRVQGGAVRTEGRFVVGEGDPVPDPVEALGLDDPGDVFERPGQALRRLFIAACADYSVAFVMNTAEGATGPFWEGVAFKFAEHLGHGAKPEATDLPMDGTQASYRQILEQALRVMDEAAGFDERDRALVEAHERLSGLMAMADQLEGKVEGTITLGLDVLATVKTVHVETVQAPCAHNDALAYREIAEAALRALSSASYFSFRPDWSPRDSCAAAGKELNRLREALIQADKAARAHTPASVEPDDDDAEEQTRSILVRLRRLEDRVALIVRTEARRLETPAPEGQP